MKNGEPSPRGARELVLRLAASTPRPTNRAIVEAVQRTFGETAELSDRTVRRYCEKAGLPTSSRRATHSQGADVGFGPHGRELFYFGQRLRDSLSLGVPDESGELVGKRGQKLIWVGRSSVVGWANGPRDTEEVSVDREWGFGRYDARGHSLFSPFQQHLVGSPCWAALEQVMKDFELHRNLCLKAGKRIMKEVADRQPTLAEGDLRAMTESLLMDAYHRLTGSVGLLFSYEPHQLVEGNKIWWHLQLGAWGVGHVEAPVELEPLASVHRDLSNALLSMTVVKALAKAHRAATQAIREFRQSLSPDARLRKLILNGRCDLCP